MRRVLTAFRFARRELAQAVLSPQMICSVLCLLVVLLMGIEPVVSYTREISQTINSLEVFVVVSNDRHSSLFF